MRAPAGLLTPSEAVRVEEPLAWLVEDGAAACDALRILLVALEAEGPAALVIDMPEQGLDQATQAALVARLRGRDRQARPLFLLIRSSAILDLTAVGPDETILYCPANHDSPSRVAPTQARPATRRSPVAWPRRTCARERRAWSR